LGQGLTKEGSGDHMKECIGMEEHEDYLSAVNMQVSTDKVMSSCCLQQQRSGKMKDNRKGKGILKG
jgi:hypothetical protein